MASGKKIFSFVKNDNLIKRPFFSDLNCNAYYSMQNNACVRKVNGLWENVIILCN